MNCKQIQELILTDYIDARMGDKQKGLIDQHLVHCHTCDDFLMSVKRQAVGPFKDVREFVPDGSLWAQVKQAIEEDQQRQIEKSLIPDFWERLRSVVHVPRPAFVLATIVTMIFMIGSTGQLFISDQFVKINGQDQVEYISSLIDEPVDVAGNNGGDPQTPIEKYFL